VIGGKVVPRRLPCCKRRFRVNPQPRRKNDVKWRKKNGFQRVARA